MFRNIGILALACFSFLITDETITVVKESDALMVEIKEKAGNYLVESIDGVIDDKYIKVGYNGLQIDVLKSYDQMKRIGYFNESMLIYKSVDHNNSLKNNHDKIVNASFKNEVSLLFKNPKDLNIILKILKNNGLNASFLISKEYYLNNFESLNNALNESNDVVILDEYKFFKKELKNFNYYCYSNLYQNCHGKFIVESNIEVNNYNDLKENLSKGNIILLDDSNYLNIYIKYILSKGIKIVNISDFINEKI